MSLTIANRNTNNKVSLPQGEEASEAEGNLFSPVSISSNGLEDAAAVTHADEADELVDSPYRKSHSVMIPVKLDENDQDPGDFPMMIIGPIGGKGMSETDITSGGT